MTVTGMLARAAVRQLAASFTFSAKVLDVNKSLVYTAQCYTTQAEERPLRVREQAECLNVIVRDTSTSRDWPTVKSDILSKSGNINPKNVDAVILKSLITANNYGAAKSLTGHLLKTENDLSLGTINAILNLHYHIGKESELSPSDVDFIRSTYKSLYDKYKMLDSATCESLVRALALIGDWKDCLKVLEDIKVTSVPSHIAYSTVIAAMFKCAEKEQAMNLIRTSVQDDRPLMDTAYESWIEYVTRSSVNDANRMLAGMEEINTFISHNCLRISKNVADTICGIYKSNLKWQASHAEVSESGKCHSCKTLLDRASLTSEEFSLLQSSFKERVLVGGDVFLKTSPGELSEFVKCIEKSAPYDMVLDALNIAYAVGAGSQKRRLNFLNSVVRHFRERDKTIFLIGRQHMLSWPKREMNFLLHNTTHFFTNDLSQDDPFFITAAIFGGVKTDFLSRDKLRGHRFLLRDNKLRSIFLRWQWQHQWMYSVKAGNVPVIKKPINFTPSAQRSTGWHLPYEQESYCNYEDPMNAATPIPANWLCLQPPVHK